jgi:hypothetical protein
MSTISTPVPFNYFKFLLGTAVINLNTNAFKIAAVTSAPGPDGTTGSALSAGLTRATNVADVALPGTVTYTQNDTSDKGELKSTGTTTVDIICTGASGAIVGFVLYDDTVSSPAKPCVAYMALDAPVTLVNAGDKFTMTAPTGGIWLTV